MKQTQNCGDVRRREVEGAASAFELCTLMATHKQEWSFSEMLSSLQVNTASVIGLLPGHSAACSAVLALAFLALKDGVANLRRLFLPESVRRLPFVV